MLQNRVTGEDREVDVVIRSMVAGQEMILGVEATMKKGSSPWVEQMIGKHADLPTDRLVLVAETGFSRPARRYAAQKGVALIAPEDFQGDNPSLRVVSRIERMWPKGLALTPEGLRILVRKPDGSLLRVRDAPSDGLLCFLDGTVIETHWAAFKMAFETQFPRLAEMVDLAGTTEDRDEPFFLQVGHSDAPFELVRRGSLEPVYLRWEVSDPPEMHQVIVMEYSGRLVINVAEVTLTHKRFAKANVAYGEASFGGQDTLFVLTEDEQGGKLSMRFREGAPEPEPTVDTGSASGYAGRSGDCNGESR